MKATVTIIGRSVDEGTTRRIIVSEEDYAHIQGAHVKINKITGAPTILQLGSSTVRLAKPISFSQLLFGVTKIPNNKGWDKGMWNTSRDQYRLSTESLNRIDAHAPNHAGILRDKQMSKSEQKTTFKRIARTPIISEGEDVVIPKSVSRIPTRVSISFPNGVVLSGAKAEIINVPMQTLQALKNI